MAYKPVSQVILDNKDAEIPSSDAIFDTIAAVIPDQTDNAGKFLTTDGVDTSWGVVDLSDLANRSLSNLTAPTAVNQDLLLDVGKKIRLNASEDVNTLLHVKSDTFVNTGVTVTRATQYQTLGTTFTTNSSITGILAVNDYIRLNGLENIVRVTAINSSTSITVSGTNLFHDRTTELTREIQKIKPMVVLRDSANAETITFTESQAFFPRGQHQGNGADYIQGISLPGISFAGNENVGFAAPVANQISILGPIKSDGIGRYNTERFRFTCSDTTILSLFGTSQINFIRAGSFSIGMQLLPDYGSPTTIISGDFSRTSFHKNLISGVADSSQTLYSDNSAFCFGIYTNNGLASVSANRFFGGAFRQKLQVGNFSNPGWFLDGGILSVHGLDEDIGINSFIKANGTNVIYHISNYAGSTRVATGVRAVGMGIGDIIQIRKTNFPTIHRKIIEEGSSISDDGNTYGFSGLKYVLDDVVSSDYEGAEIAVLPPLVRVATQNDAEVIEVDYAGNSKFKPVQAVELSSGNLSIAALGRSLQMATGSNAAAGLATIANGTAEVTVSTNACGPNSIILATNQTSTDYVSVTTKALGSFKLEHDSNVASDQSIAWFIINPEDTDYVSFINTASISDSTQRSAIATLISSLKSQGLWDAMYAIYPFVGGSSASHSYNLKNPAEYQITWSGTVTHDANGITGDGIDGYGDTNLAGNLLFQNNQHLSVYSRTNSSLTATDIGAEIAAGGTKGSHFSIRNPAKFALSAVQTSTNNLLSNSQGLFVATRRVSNAQVFFRNTNIQAQSAAVNSEALTFPETITIGARKSGASVVDYSTRNYAFASIGKGLTRPQVARLYEIVQAFQTALGRNV